MMLEITQSVTGTFKPSIHSQVPLLSFSINLHFKATTGIPSNELFTVKTTEVWNESLGGTTEQKSKMLRFNTWLMLRLK